MEKFLFALFILTLLLEFIFPSKRDKAYFGPIVPLAIGGAQALGQLLGARKQKKEARKALDYMPPALTEATNTARAQSQSQRYAGQDIDEANVRQTTADTFGNVAKSTTSTGALLNAASQLNTAQARGMQQIGQKAMNFRENAMDKYRQMLLQKADVQIGNKRYSEALKGSAMQNRMNALNSVLSGVAASDFGGKAPKMFGTGVDTSKFTGYRFDPNRFSSFKFDPNSFSSNYSY